MFATAAAMMLAAGLLGAPAQQAADLSVDLNAQSFPVLLPTARYDITVTNHGPDPLESATVVVTFEYQGAQSPPPQCVRDVAAKTLTCTFGPLPVGASATVSEFAVYWISGPAREVNTTANRTASTPADPNPGNDTDTESCTFTGGPTGNPPGTIPPMIC